MAGQNCEFWVKVKLLNVVVPVVDMFQRFRPAQLCLGYKVDWLISINGFVC